MYTVHPDYQTSSPPALHQQLCGAAQECSAGGAGASDRAPVRPHPQLSGGDATRVPTISSGATRSGGLRATCQRMVAGSSIDRLGIKVAQCLTISDRGTPGL